MVNIIADRLYLGDMLIWESPTGKTSVVDLFDRETLGPLYEVVSVLRETPFSAQIVDRELVFSGYTPTAVRDFGNTNGTITVRGSGAAQPQIVFRYVDNDNWLSWTPDNGPAGRFRVRYNGVSIDTTLPRALTSNSPVFVVTMDGEDISFYRNGALIASVQDANHIGATKHGFGTATTSGTRAGHLLQWDDGDGPNIDPPPRYFDPTETTNAVDTATTIPEVLTATTDLHQFHNVTIAIGSSDQISDPALKTAIKCVVRALAEFPRAFRGNFNPFSVNISHAHTTSGSATGSNLTVRSTPTPAQFESVDAELEDALIFVTCHEIGHMLHRSSGAPSAATLETAFRAANTSGFSYGGSAIAGPRPTGFCRGYGTQHVREDIADVIGWMMTPALVPQLNGWIASDSHLAAKVAAVKTFAQSLSWPADHFDHIGV